MNFNEDLFKQWGEYIEESFARKHRIQQLFLSDAMCIGDVAMAADILVESLKNGGKVIACGNGGSMSDAMHFCSELTGKFIEQRDPISAIAISDPAHLSCVANDFGYDRVFSRYVEAHGKKGDTLLAISTSGNSENIHQAVLMAWREQMNVVLLTGNNGGKTYHMMWNRAQNATLEMPRMVAVRIPSGYTADVQEVHIQVIHILVDLIEKGVIYRR
jgi:D-sedoheptulose 7-phosphate isomerase